MKVKTMNDPVTKIIGMILRKIGNFNQPNSLSIRYYNFVEYIKTSCRFNPITFVNRLVSPFKIAPKMLLLQYFWIISHLLTLIGTFGYLNTHEYLRNSSTYTNNVYNKMFYMIANIGAVVTYSVVLYRHISIDSIIQPVDSINYIWPVSPVQAFNRRDDIISSDIISFHNAAEYHGFNGNDYMNEYGNTNNQSIKTSIQLSDILRSENAHLLAFSVLWLISSQNIFKILPFAIYSTLNLGQFLIGEVFIESSFAAAFTPLLNYTETPLLIAAADIDIVVFSVLFKEFLYTGNAYCFVFYAFIWGLRIESSDSSRASLHGIINMIHYSLEVPVFPSIALRIWIKIENQLKKIVPLYRQPVVGFHGVAVDNGIDNDDDDGDDDDDLYDIMDDASIMTNDSEDVETVFV